jgi:hypothetical protein
MATVTLWRPVDVAQAKIDGQYGVIGTVLMDLLRPD